MCSPAEKLAESEHENPDHILEAHIRLQYYIASCQNQR